MREKSLIVVECGLAGEKCGLPGAGRLSPGSIAEQRGKIKKGKSFSARLQYM
jgi:hypothetical protein